MLTTLRFLSRFFSLLPKCITIFYVNELSVFKLNVAEELQRSFNL